MKIVRNYFILLLSLISACNLKIKANKDIIFVSILPQKEFVESIVGDSFEVSVIVRPGFDPETYEPTPQQMMRLSEAKILFSIGVPFEKAWLEKIQSANENLKIVDTSAGIELRSMDNFRDIVENNNLKKEKQKKSALKDPHIWLSPKLVQVQLRNILNNLIEIYPDKKEIFQTNYRKYNLQLANLASEIDKLKNHLKAHEFLVFHPAFGYLATDLGIRQIPIEIEGKQPTAKSLAQIITFCKKEDIHTIIVQQQFSRREADSVAKAIDGKVIVLDPLAPDYIENMKKIITIIQSNY